MASGMAWMLELAESGRAPDWLIRQGIRRLLERRRRALVATPEGWQERRAAIFETLSEGAVTESVEAANAQHYEVPTRFYQLCLGPRLKYSCALYEPGTRTLAEAEDAMLARTCERAGIRDGDRILELGCGWGSLTLFMAERFPRSEILAISNSAGQREHIRAEAERRGFTKVSVRTTDVAALELDEASFDRVVSVEMFEHVRNHLQLMGSIRRWLRPGGALFVHHFSHRDSPYLFEDEGADDWMARHFFTGGVMPSHDLLLNLNGGLRPERQWVVGGVHYGETCLAWLQNLDRRRAEVEAALGAGVDGAEARLRTRRWRLFFMACEELFRARGGAEWFVSHSRFVKDD